MPVATTRLRSAQGRIRSIVWRSIIVAVCLPLGYSDARGQEPRTWVLSDAHAHSVAHLAFSPDGQILATASRDGTIKLWELSTGRVRSTLDADLAWLPNVLAFSPDGKILASGFGIGPKSPDGRTPRPDLGGVTLWDVAAGRRLADPQVPPGRPLALVFSRDGETLALATADGAVRLWDLARDRLRSEIGVPASRPVALSPDLETVAVANRDATIQLRSTATGRERVMLKGHRNRIWSLAFSPDGKLLASGAGDPSASTGRDSRSGYPSEVKLWDLTSDQPRERASLTGLTLEIQAVAFSADSRLVAAGGFGDQVRVWETASGTPVADLEASCSGISTLAFSRDGASLGAGGLYQSISVWDTRAWHERSRLVGRIAYRLAYTPDGKTLAAGLSDGTVALWDVAGGRVRAVLQGHAHRVSSLAVSPDGKRLAAGDVDGKIKIWDPNTGRRRGNQYYGHAGDVTALAFSPDGKAMASGGKDTTVRVWDVASLRQVAVLKGHQFEVSAVAFSPDGATLASAGHDGYLRFWDVAGRREKAVIRGHTIQVSQSREETRIIDGETVTYSVAIPGTTKDKEVPLYSLAYSPDGKSLATGDRGMEATGGVSLRDPRTGEERAAFKPAPGGFYNDINALAYSPDGKILASAGYSTIRLSDAATGKVLVTLKTGVTFPLRDLAFSPDGRTLASCGYQIVHFWDVGVALRKEAGK